MEDSRDTTAAPEIRRWRVSIPALLHKNIKPFLEELLI